MIYSDPILEKYIQLIKANTATIRTFFQGEPIKIAASDLPCVFISKRETQVGVFTNAEDTHMIGLSLTVITDIRNDLSTEEQIKETVDGVASLYDIVEGRDDDYTLKDESLLAILRHNIAVDLAHNLRTDLNSITRVDYSSTLRGRPAQEWTVQAKIDFTAHFDQVR